MEGVLDQRMRSEVIKLAHSKTWIWPYGPYIRFAFGISPIPSDPLGAYHVLDSRFQKQTPEDKDIIYLWECLAEYSVLAIDLLSEFGIPLSQVKRLWINWIESFNRVDPSAVLDLTISSVSLMQEYFDSYIHDENVEAIATKMVECRQIKAFTAFFRAVVAAITEVSDEVQIVRTLRELSEYLGRVKSESRVQCLQKNDLKKYIAQERDMDGWMFDGEILSEMKQIITRWYPENLWRQEMSNFCPILSAGSPYGSTRRKGGSAYYKYNAFALNAKLINWFSKYNIFNGIPTFSLNQCENTDDNQDLGLPAKMPAHNPIVQMAGNRSFVCELVYVPKTAKKLRTISKESPYLSYLQHGVQHAMVKIGRKTSLANHVDYSRADISAELARAGSQNGFYDTLDLSAASDSVHIKLVENCFPDYMRDALIATRSDYVQLPNKEIIFMNKFAPMGSATCFPVETTVFAAVCELAKKWTRLPFAHYRVYGDDIVCDSRLTVTINYLLKSLHFKVNRLKSFTGYSKHTFREACGGEFCNGFDVKPIRVSRQRYSVFAMSTEVVRESYTDMMHETWFPYRGIARLLYHRLDSLIVDFKQFEGNRIISGSLTRLSRGLPWAHIKEHPVYNPAMVCGTYRNFQSCVALQDKETDPHDDKDVVLLELNSIESHSSYFRPSGSSAYGWTNGYRDSAINAPFCVDSGLAALWSWLARAARRSELVDKHEYSGRSLPFLYELELIEPDDEFSEPSRCESDKTVAVFASSRMYTERFARIKSKVCEN